MNIASFFKGLFKIGTMTAEERYLSSSIDHADLERRIKEIDRGHAPFQKHIF